MDQLAGCCKDGKRVASCKNGVDECVCAVCGRRWKEPCRTGYPPADTSEASTQQRAETIARTETTRAFNQGQQRDLLNVDCACSGYTITDDDGGKRHVWPIDGESFVIRTRGERPDYVGHEVVTVPSRLVRVQGDVA